MKKKILVIGAGAAGLMAACAASDAGADVTIYEKNEKAGKKIYITGKGRCNFTNACDTAEFFDHVVSNPKFLYSAVYGFDHEAVTAFMEANGCRTKVERGKRAFPASDHASDITRALTDHLKKNHVRILFHETVRDILTEDAGDGKRKVTGILLESGKSVPAAAVILAAGGLSYPSTGSTGDGYRFAKALGLALTPQAPSLVPLVCRQKWPMALQGLSLRNVSIAVYERAPEKETSGMQDAAADLQPDAASPRQPDAGKKKKAGKKKHRPVYEGFGELMFTHFGLTGPLILSASAHCDFLKVPQGYDLYLDLKPAIPQEELTERILREFQEAPDKAFGNALRPLFPERLAETVAELFARHELGIPEEMGDQPEEADTRTRVAAYLERKARSFNRKEVDTLAQLIRKIPITITGTRGFAEAIITRGGISVREFDPSTMEAKKIRGLYAAGEVLDVDALTGGFNLQIAWSTGHLAGVSAAEEP